MQILTSAKMMQLLLTIPSPNYSNDFLNVEEDDEQLPTTSAAVCNLTSDEELSYTLKIGGVEVKGVPLTLRCGNAVLHTTSGKTSLMRNQQLAESVVSVTPPPRPMQHFQYDFEDDDNSSENESETAEAFRNLLRFSPSPRKPSTAAVQNSAPETPSVSVRRQSNDLAVSPPPLENKSIYDSRRKTLLETPVSTNKNKSSFANIVPRQLNFENVAPKPKQPLCRNKRKRSRSRGESCEDEPPLRKGKIDLSIVKVKDDDVAMVGRELKSFSDSKEINKKTLKSVNAKDWTCAPKDIIEVGLVNKAKREYIVEDILNVTIRKNQASFLVKWDGWSEEFNSWEPRKNIANLQCFDWAKGTKTSVDMKMRFEDYLAA